ncbi:hypothetical protein [Sphingobacterium ginsenosidimutans]|uniref:Uncharacterized protein n=1 Tax=Sphingobacterium ginsenosidimutans TaxID=687845 RepID=A0ABP8AET2_9SPHI
MTETYKNNLFFALSKRQEKKDFDSYSKNENDIYNFYLSKVIELPRIFKQTDIFELSTFRFYDEDLGNINTLLLNRRLNSSFELYISSFVSFINKQYLIANYLFHQVLKHLKMMTDIGTYVNVQFIKLQISQCFDLNGDRRSSLRYLLDVVRGFSQNHLLLLHANNLLASTYMRIGVYCERVYNNYGLAHYTTFKSCYLRDLFREKYPNLVCEQYLATAFRLYAKTWTKSVDQYYWFSKSLQQRMLVLQGTNDNFNKAELMFLLFDFCRFLILNKYKIAIINSKAKLLLKIFCAMEPQSRLEYALAASQYSMMISKSLMSLGCVGFIKWLYITEYFVQKINDTKTINAFVAFKQKVEQFFEEN